MNRAGALALLLFAACNLPSLDAPEPECADPKAFWPDVDGDGLGEPTTVFIGCEAPEGYVDVVYVPPDGDSGDTGDSGDSGDSGA